MKTLFKKVLANYICLWIISVLLTPGFIINNGLVGYTKAVIVLSFLYPVVKVLGKIILIPINFFTLGFLGFFLNLFLIYLFTIIVSDIQISSLTIKQSYLMIFNINEFYISKFGVILIVTILLSLFQKIFMWIMS